MSVDEDVLEFTRSSSELVADVACNRISDRCLVIGACPLNCLFHAVPQTAHSLQDTEQVVLMFGQHALRLAICNFDYSFQVEFPGIPIVSS